MDRMDGIMRQTSEMAEDNSATTQQMAAGMEETTASATMIAGNVNTIKQNTNGIKELSKEGQAVSDEVKDRARQLRSVTAASSDKAMEIFQNMKGKQRKRSSSQRQWIRLMASQKILKRFPHRQIYLR